MIAIVGGLGAAICFAISTLCASRASRLIGASSTVAWVTTLGLIISLPFLASAPTVPSISQIGWLAISGFGNSGALLLVYAAMKTGKVGVIAPIVSTEGALVAAIAVVAGESLSASAVLALAVAALGAVLVASPRAEDEDDQARVAAGAVRACLAAVVGAVSLYATGRVASLPLIWLVIPSRAVGFSFIALPFLAKRRLRFARAAAPMVAVAAACEVVGFVSYGLGARHGIALAAVLTSLYSALSALGGYVFFSERLGPRAVLGIGAIIVGVGALTSMQ
jgi:drug/metabolite transporter (DMT)-like permease